MQYNVPCSVMVSTQGEAYFIASVSWDRLQTHGDHSLNKTFRKRGWMDGWRETTAGEWLSGLGPRALEGLQLKSQG